MCNGCTFSILTIKIVGTKMDYCADMMNMQINAGLNQNHDTWLPLKQNHDLSQLSTQKDFFALLNNYMSDLLVKLL